MFTHLQLRLSTATSNFECLYMICIWDIFVKRIPKYHIKTKFKPEKHKRREQQDKHYITKHIYHAFINVNNYGQLMCDSDFDS